MTELISLCTDIVTESEKSDDPVLLDSLMGLKNHRVFRHADDDDLQSFLKCVNHLLNEPKTRMKGLMLVDNFVTQIDPSRLVGIQNSLQSTLNLLAKCLNFDLTHRILVNLLPMCYKLPELSQSFVSAIIPKFFVHLIENAKSSSSQLPNHQEMMLLIACMEKYRGPSGQYRQQIERIIIPFIDLHNQDEIGFQNMARIFPLLSATGGGGNKGDKYGQDWFDNVTRILNALYDALVSLLGDVCPYFDNENPYVIEGGRSLDLNTIRHTNVFMRMSLMNRRILNLSNVLASFLLEPFPAPKSVPIHGILNLLANMTMINPINLLKPKASGGHDDDEDAVVPKENINLANILPSLHLAALELLDKLILSCGNQLFPEASRLELLLVQEFKWIVEKPGSFENLKTQLYKTFKSWLKITNGSISNNKNATLLLQQIIQDIRIDKQGVSLTLGVKAKGKGKNKNKQSISTSNLLNTTKTTDVKEGDKSELVCMTALECLELLIPSLDFASHRAAYLILATTVGTFTESSDLTSPYITSECRSNAFKCLVQLALNPHHKSPVSLGLINSLLELGIKDGNHKVVAECHQMLNIVERIIHPSGPTLQFPQISVVVPSNSVENQDLVMDESIQNNIMQDNDDDDDEQSRSRINSFSQTEEGSSSEEPMELSNTLNNFAHTSIIDPTSMIREITANVTQAVTENLSQFLKVQGRRKQEEEEGEERDIVYDCSDDDDDPCIVFEDIDPSSFHKIHGDSQGISRHPSSHLALVKDIERENRQNEETKEIVEPPCKKVKSWTVGNENGFTNDKTDDDVSVTVEEILLNFDDNII